MAYQTALEVIDGVRNPTADISEEDKEIAKFLSENQEDVLEAFKKRVDKR